MHFTTIHRSKGASVLLTIEEPRPSEASSKSREERRRDSGTVNITFPKPLPTRTPSTRIQEPTRTASEINQKPTIHRGASVRSTASHRIEKVKCPGLQSRRTTARTRHIDMLLGLDDVSPFHNFLASLSVWILSRAKTLMTRRTTNLKQHALRTVRNVPLLYVAAFNYVWVINRIFLPSLLNSQYSVTAKVTVIVTSACSAVAAALSLLYNTVMLKLVKRRHAREVRDVERMFMENEEDPGVRYSMIGIIRPP
ncbi:hypothetical protein EK21DRAFT_102040 [Setomelanomma holmii]|uniref:Uncharacterized protein n=1 Tax=Setomelanomma holmii TaxID=210430 RepID=A0A9P4H5U1_9PLEO|nr:hypothetical protein EK21DRAFT_102040 [Setomelanomma holmii]